MTTGMWRFIGMSPDPSLWVFDWAWRRTRNRVRPGKVIGVPGGFSLDPDQWQPKIK
jgi:hypothetical protein